MDANDPRTLLPGVFPDRKTAEDAAAALKQELAIDGHDIAVVVPAPGKYYVENQEERSMLQGFVGGLAAGILVGALAGMVIAVFAVPGESRVGLAGALVLGGIGGAVWGAFFGGVAGMAAREHGGEDKDERYTIAAGSSQVLVTVTAEDEMDRARAIMQRHGVQCFLEHTLDASPLSVAPAPSMPLTVPAGSGA